VIAGAVPRRLQQNALAAGLGAIVAAICGVAASQFGREPFILIFLVAGLGVVISRWRLAIYGAMAMSTVSGILALILPLGEPGRLMPQLMAALAYLAFALDCLRRREWPRPRGLAPLATAFLALAWLLNSVNPEQFSLKVVALGLVSYVYFIPLMFLGYALVREAKQARNLVAFLAVISIVVAVVGAVQFVLGPARVQALLPGFNPFGQGTSNGLSAFRFPSTFAAVTQLQDFLTLASIILLGACLELTGWRRALALAGFAGLFFIGIINVSRTYYVTLPAGLFLLGLNLWRRRRNRGAAPSAARPAALPRRVLQIGLLLAFGSLATVAAIRLAGDIVGPRLATLRPDDPGFNSDIVSRFTKSAQTLDDLVLSDHGWWHGHGTGTSTPYLFHIDLEPAIVEAFIPEVVYQAGVLGLAAYAFLYGATFIICRQAILQAPDRATSTWVCVFSAYLMLIVIESGLGGEDLVLFPSAMFFWLILGAVIGLRDGLPAGARSTQP
jgi:hypothetical protein